MTDPHTIVEFCGMAVLVGPIYEEFIYRGIAVSGLERPSRNWTPVLVSAVIFCIPHYVPGRGLLPFIGPFVLGLFLAWSYLRTRCVLTSFLVHAAFNCGVIFKDYLMHFHPGLIRHILGYE